MKFSSQFIEESVALSLTRSPPSTIYSTLLATDIVPRLFTLESIGLVNSFPKT